MSRATYILVKFVQYVSCSWPKSDKTFWTSFWSEIFLTNIFKTQNFLQTQNFSYPMIFFVHKIFLVHNFFGPKSFLDTFYESKISLDQNFLLIHKFFLTIICLELGYFHWITGENLSKLNKTQVFLCLNIGNFLIKKSQNLRFTVTLYDSIKPNIIIVESVWDLIS